MGSCPNAAKPRKPRQRCARAKRQTGTGMLSISATAGSCPVIARSRRQSACLATHKVAACRAKVVRWTCRRPGNRWPKWRRKWACRPRSVSRPRNSPTISTVSTSLSARTGAGPRWRSRHSRHRSRRKSSTRQNTTMMRVSRSMAAAHEVALPRTNRCRAPESYGTSAARENPHVGLAGVEGGAAVRIEAQLLADLPQDEPAAERGALDDVETAEAGREFVGGGDVRATRQAGDVGALQAERREIGL